MEVGAIRRLLMEVRAVRDKSAGEGGVAGNSAEERAGGARNFYLSQKIAGVEAIPDKAGRGCRWWIVHKTFDPCLDTGEVGEGPVVESPVEAVPDKTRRKEDGVADNFTEGDEFPEENAAVLEKLEKNGAFATLAGGVEAVREAAEEVEEVVAGGSSTKAFDPCLDTGEVGEGPVVESPVEAVREAAGRVEEPGVESPVEAKKGPPGRRRWWNVRGERTQ